MLNHVYPLENSLKTCFKIILLGMLFMTVNLSVVKIQRYLRPRFGHFTATTLTLAKLKELAVHKYFQVSG